MYYNKIDSRQNQYAQITHNKMASITLDYVLFIKQFIVAQAANKWHKPQDGKPMLQVWNEIFNELHIPLQYLYQLIYHSHTIASVQSSYSLENMHNLVTQMYNAPRTYVEQSFQEYIDERVNFTPLNISNGTPSGRHSRDLRATLPINELKGNPPAEDCPISNLHRCKSTDYQAFIKNITYPTFKQNLYAKYQKDFEVMALKNLIIQECRDSTDNDAYLNMIPYLEYVTMKKSHRTTIKQTYILELEEQTHQIINQQIN